MKIKILPSNIPPFPSSLNLQTIAPDVQVAMKKIPEEKEVIMNWGLELHYFIILVLIYNSHSYYTNRH